MRKTLLFAFTLFVLTAVAAELEQFENKLPPPYATPSADNPPDVIARPAGAQLHVPQGFQVEEYAAGFDQPRFMLEGSNGEILLTDSAAGSVYVLVDKNKSYKNPERKKVLTGLDRPYGLALWNNYLYVGERTSIKRYKYDSHAFTASSGQEIASLKGFTADHWTRSLLFDTKGEKLYVGIGSGANVEVGENPMRAAINRLIRMGLGTRYSPPGHAIPSESTGILERRHCGRRCRSAMSLAITWSPTSSLISNKEGSTVGLTPMLDRIRNRACRRVPI